MCDTVSLSDAFPTYYTGGPKDLPIAKVSLDDDETEDNKKLQEKPRLVIVGGGWGVRTLSALQRTPI